MYVIVSDRDDVIVLDASGCALGFETQAEAHDCVLEMQKLSKSQRKFRVVRLGFPERVYQPTRTQRDDKPLVRMNSGLFTPSWQ